MLRNCFYANIFSSNLAEAGDLLDDVLVGVLEPLVEGDGAAVVGVHRLEVLLALLEPLLQK